MNKLILILNCTFLVYFKWYRRLVGGNWEKWYVDYPVCADVWHHDSEGSLRAWNGKPSPLCRGNPQKMEWYAITKEIDKLINTPYNQKVS